MQLPPVGPSSIVTPFSSPSRVRLPLLTQVLDVAGGRVVWVVDETRRQKPDLRDPQEGIEHRLVPPRRGFDHVVVELDEVSCVAMAKACAYAFMPMFSG